MPSEYHQFSLFAGPVLSEPQYCEVAIIDQLLKSNGHIETIEKGMPTAYGGVVLLKRDKYPFPIWFVNALPVSEIYSDDPKVRLLAK